jgi:hypothetical protein
MAIELTGCIDTMPTLSEMLEKAQTELERAKVAQLKWIEKNHAEKVALIEQNFQAIPLLEGYGTISVNRWQEGSRYTLDMGELPSRGKRARAEFAARLRDVRRVVGRMTTNSTDVLDDKSRTVRVSKTGDNYPGIVVQWTAKLTRKSKCKIVRQYYTTVICES